MTKKERDQLIMKYVPLVKNVVGRITSRMPAHVADREDLMHVGIIGLMSALEKYDANRNVQFETYARFRIRGAVLEPLVRGILEELGEAGIGRVIEYKLISGQPGASVFWHMLQHVVNHASYHRGQVTTMLRQLGAASSKSMDLIAFYRVRDQAGQQ